MVILGQVDSRLILFCSTVTYLAYVVIAVVELSVRYVSVKNALVLQT